MQISRDIITSRQNAAVSLAASLELRKAREREGLFRFDGKKLFLEALESQTTVRYVFLCHRECETFLPLMEEKRESLENARVMILSDELFGRLSEERAPEGILTVAEPPAIHTHGEDAARSLAEKAASGERILLLESVRDPGNVGTVLRSALAFGTGLVVLSRDCADLWNPKTVRGGMGALFRLPTASFDDLGDAVSILRQKGRRVLGAALDREALPLGKGVLASGDCVVIGNEGHGLSVSLLDVCDGKLFIPMESHSESLNAAMAASVILWSMYAGL